MKAVERLKAANDLIERSLPLLVALAGLAAGLVCLAPGLGAFPPATPPAPWQRMLKGEDGKRVEELEKKINELRRAGKNAEAQEPARAILEIRRRVQGEDHWQTADARRLLERLRRITALSASAQAELAEATKLEGESSGLNQRGRYREAVSLQRRALAIRQRHLGDEESETAKALNNLAFSLNASGNYAAAQPLYEKALRIWRTALGEEHPTTATSYNNVAHNLAAQGRRAEAQPLDEKALRIRRKALGDNHPDTAASYNNVAHNLYAQGRYAEAQPLLEKALRIWRTALGDEHPNTAHGYNSVAVNLAAQGRYAEAQPLHEKTLQIFRRALGEDHPHTALSYNSVAVNLAAQGRYAEAQPLLEKALRICRTALGDEHPDTARSYNYVAANLNDQGRYAEAQPLYEKALRIRRKALGEDHPDTAVSYNSVAANLNDQGRYAEAQPLFEKALRILRKALGEDHPDTAAGYDNVAYNLVAQGRYAEAQPLCEKALRIRRKALGEDHPDTAISYNNVAASLKDQGRYAEAQPLYEKALQIRRTALGEDHPHTALSYSNVAYNLGAQGRYAEAEAQWASAAAGFDVARLRSDPSGMGSALFGRGPAPWVSLAACRAHLGRPAEAWRGLEAGLARGLLNDISARLAPGLSPAEQQRRQELDARLAQLDRQIAAVLAAKEPSDQTKARFRELARQRQEVQDELARLAGDLSARQVYGLQRIQAQVPADAALVAWVDTRSLPKAADPSGEHWACILRHTRPPAWVKLPGSGEHGTWTPDDDELPGRFRQAVSSPPGKDREDLEELSRRLASQRLAPLEQHLTATGDMPAVRRLLVVPVWGMAGVPVEALTDRYAVSYVSSGTVFARLAEQRHKDPAQADAPRLLAVGDPAFLRSPERKPLAAPPDHGALLVQVQPGSNAAQSGLRPGDLLLSYGGRKLSAAADLSAAIKAKVEEKPANGTRGAAGIPVEVWRDGQRLTLAVRPGPLGVGSSQRSAAEEIRSRREGDEALRTSRGKAYARLPGTRQEVQAIAGLFPQPGVLLDQEASAARLQELAAAGELQKYRYLHFATHGEVDPGVAFNSALILAPDTRVTAAGPPQEPDNHSRLTAAQMLKWKVNADLVVLSACESGLGRQAGGEGFLGFAQALFYAGARSVVLSLWKVDDTATALLMTRFYQNLLGKRDGLDRPLPKAEALQEAKTWLRGLSRAEARRLAQGLPGAGRLKTAAVPERGASSSDRPYAHPYFWAAFILIGDPT
jgi:tetratricopeptide (TPR) repeat protein